MEYWDGFDTSHWKTTDKAWMAERKQQWLEMNAMSDEMPAAQEDGGFEE